MFTRISSAPTDDVVASPSVRTKAAEAKHSSLACITIDRWSGPRSADVDSLILHSPANVKASRSGVSLMSYLLCLCLPLRKQRGEVPAHHYCSQSVSRILTGRQKNWPPPPPAKEGRFQRSSTPLQSVSILTGRQKNLATATARQKCRWNRDREIPVRAQQNSPDGFNVGREEYPPRGLIGRCTCHGWPALGLLLGWMPGCVNKIKNK